MRHSRKTHDGQYFSLQQLPFNFDIMLEYLSNMTKRNEKINEIEQIGVSRSKAEKTIDKFMELFDLRSHTLERDLVGMEEVKTRLKRKHEEIEELKKLALEKKKRQLKELKE